MKMNIANSAENIPISRAAPSIVMEEKDTGQETQRVLDIKCEVDFTEEEGEQTNFGGPATSEIAIKKEVDEDCVVKTEVKDVGLPSNPFMVAANQLHNLKVKCSIQKKKNISASFLILLFSSTDEEGG